MNSGVSVKLSRPDAVLTFISIEHKHINILRWLDVCEREIDRMCVKENNGDIQREKFF